MAEKTPDDIDAVIERECREWMASPTHEPMDYRVPGLLRRIDRLAAQLNEARDSLVKYGNHSLACLLMNCERKHKGAPTNCECGFDAATAFLAATEPKP